METGRLDSTKNTILMLKFLVRLTLSLIILANCTIGETGTLVSNNLKSYSYVHLITEFEPQVHEARDPFSGLLHPGLGLTKLHLDTMQRHVRNRDEPWASAFELFAKNGRSSLTPRVYYSPQWTEILHGPAGRDGNFITVRMAMDADIAFHQIIMWYVTGNERYRINAMNVIRDYFSITKIERHWDSQIRWGIAAYKFCFVVDLLRHTSGNTEFSQWTEKDQSLFTHLMRMGLSLVIDPGYWMNQHQFATMGMIGTAVSLDDKLLYQQAIERTTVNSAGEQGGRNGSIKWQMRLVTEDAESGRKIDKPQVQIVEMARDQGHAWIDPTALSLLAQVAFNQRTRVDPEHGVPSERPDAVEVFEFLDNRLLAGADYITRYSFGENVQWIPVVMSGGASPVIGRVIAGPPRKMTQGILYNYYRYIKKWDKSDSRFRAVAYAYESNFPEDDGGTDMPGNGTLFYTPDSGLIH